MITAKPQPRNTVPPGYKQTEVGVIPEDWEAYVLGCVCDVRDGTHESPRYQQSGVKFVTSKNIVEGKLDLENVAYISHEDADQINKRSQVDARDVLLSMIGTIGNAVLVKHTPDFCIKNIALLKPQCMTGAFLIQLIRSPIFQSLLMNSLDGGIQKFISLQALRQLQFASPNDMVEQEAIAGALSDADGWIESLEKLIAKKRAIKQGTLQALLTPPGQPGHRRLPGFDREWEVKRLGEMLTVRHGRSQRDVQVPHGPYPILATGGQIGTACRPLYDKPSVLIGRKGTINRPQYMDTPFWTVDTLFYSEVYEPNCPKYLFYRFLLIDWMQFNEASGVPSLNVATIENIEIESPGPEEQTAIAAVLSDMDAEIEALEAKLAKARQIKQGMMQELLTGRIRLVKPGRRG